MPSGKNLFETMSAGPDTLDKDAQRYMAVCRQFIAHASKIVSGPHKNLIRLPALLTGAAITLLISSVRFPSLAFFPHPVQKRASFCLTRLRAGPFRFHVFFFFS